MLSISDLGQGSRVHKCALLDSFDPFIDVLEVSLTDLKQRLDATEFILQSRRGVLRPLKLVQRNVFHVSAD